MQLPFPWNWSDTKCNFVMANKLTNNSKNFSWIFKIRKLNILWWEFKRWNVKEPFVKRSKPYAMQSSRHFFDYSSWLMSIQFRYFGIFGQNEGHNPFGCFTLPWSWQKKVFLWEFFYLSFVLTKRPVAYSRERGLIFESKYLGYSFAIYVHFVVFICQGESNYFLGIVVFVCTYYIFYCFHIFIVLFHDSFAKRRKNCMEMQIWCDTVYCPTIYPFVQRGREKMETLNLHLFAPKKREYNSPTIFAHGR